MDKRIKKIKAKEILDSRGSPTLKVTVRTENEHSSFSVPAGASTGSYEAAELRDGDKERYNGLGMLKAIRQIEDKISPVLENFEVDNQKKIDNKLIEIDGTLNKSNLGGNVMIGVSIASAKTAAKIYQLKTFEYLEELEDIKPSRAIPFLFMNMINGGKHAQSKLAFQEYQIIPQTDSLEKSLEIGSIFQHSLKEHLIENYGPLSANIGDEGGFVPDVADVDKPLKIFQEVARSSGLSEVIKFGLDTAASSFYKNEKYEIGGKIYDTESLLNLYNGIVKEFDLLSIEDPFHEEAFDDFSKLNKNGGLYVIGDDLTVTNQKRLELAINNSSINAIIIKPNQIGTLTEMLNTMKKARGNKIECIVSHRSGETNDSFIADLAMAFGCYGIKAGGLQRGERIAKYNRLKEISALK